MGKILVIEDNPSDTKTLQAMLKKFGHSADFFENPFEADAILMSSKYDLILLDWQLPQMSGITYLKRLKRLDSTSEIPVIMVTGKSTKIDIEMAKKTGVSDYILKPIKPTILQEKVARFVANTTTKNNKKNSIENSINKVFLGAICNQLELITIDPDSIRFSSKQELFPEERYKISFDILRTSQIDFLDVEIKKLLSCDDRGYIYQGNLKNLGEKFENEIRNVRDELYRNRMTDD